MLDLHGTHAVVFGVASEESIAWAAVRALHRAGARVSIAYQQRFRSRIYQLVKTGEVPLLHYEPCDVTDVDQVCAFFEELPADVDTLVHSVAWSHPDTLGKPIREVTLEEFSASLAPSSWSLLPLVREALPRMPRGGSVVAMSYLGAQRVVPGYRVMGIAKAALEAAVRELAVDVGEHDVRVNAVSAGPIRTLAATQVPGFEALLERYQHLAPLRRLVHQDDVGAAIAFLASDLARNVTGQVLFVDGGYSVVGAGT